MNENENPYDRLLSAFDERAKDAQTPALTAGRDASMRFTKGTSGNPSGRPLGARNKATQVVQSMLLENAKEITDQAISLAREGNIQALRLCFERILPRQRDAAVRFDLGSLDSAEACAAALDTVLQAIAAGELTPQEGEKMAGVVATKMKSLEQVDFARQLAKLKAEIDAEHEAKSTVGRRW